MPAIADQRERYDILTPYGRLYIERQEGDILHPALMSLTALEATRRGMNEYNFAAQYQQNPQPPSGNIVLRDWMKFYTQAEKPARFELVLQSWDTANKATELSNFSVCTTWGLKDRRLYLLDVFRQKLDFPALKQAIRDRAKLFGVNTILIEDKASGTSLIQEFHAECFSIVQAAPDLGGDKIMRLHSQTAKIKNGFVLFPREADWLNLYLNELISFPNSKYDDQVDSTVYALAWMTNNPRWSGWTDEALAGYERLIDGWWRELRWQRHLGLIR